MLHGIGSAVSGRFGPGAHLTTDTPPRPVSIHISSKARKRTKADAYVQPSK